VLKGIRENETRVQFLGYDPTVYKRRAFVISGMFATLAGVLSALSNPFVSPGAAEWLKSGEVIIMVVLGGLGTLFGPLIGAFVFFGLEEIIQDGVVFDSLRGLLTLVGLSGVADTIPDFTRRWRLVLGTVFVLFVLFLPSGLVSVPAKLEPYLPDRFRPTRATPAEQPTARGDD
jgi:branched-chain amino acid transport system permease protein